MDLAVVFIFENFNEKLQYYLAIIYFVQNAQENSACMRFSKLAQLRQIKISRDRNILILDASETAIDITAKMYRQIPR